MIKANCRERFTAADFEFVVETLSRTERDSVSLIELLTDHETRDALLDDPRLFHTILRGNAPLHISPQLYFYVLTRHVLKETGMNDRSLSDYVASLLERFSHTARMRSPADGRETSIQYLSDMLVALRDASPQQNFLIRAHIGNYALFITGIFYETVQRRSYRGAPDISYYEDVGRASYRAVSQNKFAYSWDLTGVYGSLAESFRDVRLALNRLADSLLHLDGSYGPKISLL